MRKIRERDIESYLRIRAKAMGGEVRKVEWVGRRGAPDRVLMVKARPLSNSLDCAWCKPVGHTVWVELKAPGEKPEPHQLREHIRMRETGQDVRVIDSFELVEAIMSELFI